MFYRLRNSHAEEWVVLSIAPAVLWELDCAFCVENAASSNVTRISIDERKKFASFQKIFDDCPARKRAELGIPDHYPTNPQAEVLAFGQIPPSMIIDVNFHDAHCKDKWQKNRLPTASTPKLVVKPDYFSARCDYRHWQSIQEPGDDNAIVIDIDDLPF